MGSTGQSERNEKMRAIVQNGYGSADVLRMTEIDRPAIASGEVLVRVAAAGVDRGVWHLMTGKPYAARLALGMPRDRVAGMDVAGTVAAVGAEVTRFAVGDEVFGVGRGSFAEYTAAAEGKLAHKPAGLGFAQAGVVAVSGVTALRAVRTAGRAEPGQHVLVIGASGGVGSYAVQLAKGAGARVTGVCGTAKADLVRSLGADDVIDYTTTDFADRGVRYDLIVDIGGLSRFARLRRALTPRGTLVIVGGEGGGQILGAGRTVHALALSPFVRQRLTAIIAVPGRADLETLRGLLDSGELTPAVGATYPLAEAPAAVRLLESGQARGKIALTVG
ncbi:NAD(P)-dependent alcohol dehydrogenase [Nocardia aurantia]|uniref:L-threonine 3-dehydrogenase n=1 Tax=Nocardia aurantia TaxID=2585199 RepID=A0A7K0DNN8_9NOCA|nr:NAD(P)-dependent alcohol dehydrogenase [Nocardia aurantia]MQY27365.1 L-threonine 3-dehydrogenase [Nocardia aurantia]